MTERVLKFLTTRVTARDMAILADIHELQTLTTHQISRLHFAEADARRTRRRLLLLYHYGLLNRFRKHTPRGKLPDHWVLADVGADLLARHQGIEAAPLGYRQDQAMTLAFSANLEHTKGLAESFVRFAEESQNGHGALVRWLGEHGCAYRWGSHIRPDAYVRWRQEYAELHAFVEYDTGTESLTRLRRKMWGYARLAQESGLTSVVLFAVHSHQRALNVQRTLAQDVSDTVAAYVTTHGLLHAPGPAGPIWGPVGPTAAEAVRLVDIAHRHPIARQERE